MPHAPLFAAATSAASPACPAAAKNTSDPNKTYCSASVLAVSASAVSATSMNSTRHLGQRSEEHTSELQSQSNLVCPLLLGNREHTSELQSQPSILCRVPPVRAPRSAT